VSPFTPIGPTARWKAVYADVLLKKTRGQTATYAEIGKVLDLDPESDRHTIQMSVRRAAQELLRENDTALEAVNNVGYRLVQPDEHSGLAKKQQRRAKKSLQRGHDQVVHVDFSKMDPEARKAVEVMANAFAMQLEFNRRLDVRQQNLEKAVGAVVTRQEKSEQEIQELREELERRLAALEIGS
jgi:hypothetical protein